MSRRAGRGESLVAAALMQQQGEKGTQHRGSAAGIMSKSVLLSEKVAGRTCIELEWEELAVAQPAITEEVLRSAASGDVFALEDKNLMSMPWRRIFVVRDRNEYVVFDEQGRLIVEKDDGLPGGRQSVENLVSEFSIEGFWYKPPSKPVRPSPDARREARAHRLEDVLSASSTDAADASASSKRARDNIEAEAGSGKAPPLRNYSDRPSAPSIDEDHTTTSRSDDPSGATHAADDSASADEAEAGAGDDDERAVPPSGDQSAPSLEELRTSSHSNPTDESLASSISVLDGVEAQAGSASAGEWQEGLLDDDTAASEVASKECENLLRDIIHDVMEAGDALDVGASAESGQANHSAGTLTTDERRLRNYEDNAPDSSSSAALIDRNSSSRAAHDFLVAERVILNSADRQAYRLHHGGMVALVSENTVVVARDNGKWMYVPAEDASDTLCRTSEPPPVLGVVEVVYSKPGVIAGMLMGAPEHPKEVWGGLIAYGAYIAVPCEVETRLRSARSKTSKDSNRKTFAVGDIVEQLNVPDGVQPQQATVVRVVLKTGSTEAQARKLLILFEMLSGDEVASPTPQEEPEFFPASWTNWRRRALPDATVENEEGVEAHDDTTQSSTTLLLAQIKQIEQAYAALDFRKQRNLTTFAMAVKYANANLTPTQKRQSDEAIADARRERVEALADARKKAAAAKKQKKQQEEAALGSARRSRSSAALHGDEPQRPEDERDDDEPVCGTARLHADAFDEDWPPIGDDTFEGDDDAGNGGASEGTTATGNVARSGLQPSAAQLSPGDRFSRPTSRAGRRPNGPNTTLSGVVEGQRTPGSSAGFGYALDGDCTSHSFNRHALGRNCAGTHAGAHDMTNMSRSCCHDQGSLNQGRRMPWMNNAQQVDHERGCVAGHGGSSSGQLPYGQTIHGEMGSSSGRVPQAAAGAFGTNQYCSSEQLTGGMMQPGVTGSMMGMHGSGTQSVAQRGGMPMRGAVGYADGRGWMNEGCAQHVGSNGIGYMGGGNVCIGAGVGSCNMMGTGGVQMMSGGVNMGSGYQMQQQYPTYPQLLQPQHEQQQLWAHMHQPPMPQRSASAPPHIAAMRRTYVSLLAGQAMHPTSEGQMQIAQLKYDLDLEYEQHGMRGW